MPLLGERLEQPNKQPNSFPASTGQDSCRRAVRIVDIDHLLGVRDFQIDSHGRIISPMHRVHHPWPSWCGNGDLWDVWWLLARWSSENFGERGPAKMVKPVKVVSLWMG